MGPLPWSEHDAEIVRRLWEEGYPASQIGAQIGRTRNSVLGWINRQGLHRRAVSQTVLLALPLAPPAPVEDTPPITFAPAPAGGVRFADLERKHCRWPFGQPGDDDFRCCGAERMPGAPYCAEHRAIAWVKPKKLNLRKETR